MGSLEKDKDKIYLAVHGHFYQPPRENPWLEAIEQQDSALPFHDWNERINNECYNPNSVSKIVDSKNQILNVVNNYEYMKLEDIDLLSKDLCGRLPYGVKCVAISDGYIGYISSIESQYGVVTFDDGRQEEIIDIKPYLFPLSSMSEEQKEELNDIFDLDVEVAIMHIKNGIPIITIAIT